MILPGNQGWHVAAAQALAWGHWVAQGTVSTISFATTCNTAQIITNATSTSATTIWTSWAVQHETEEQARSRRRAAKNQAERLEAQYLELQRQGQLAKEKARKLLVEHLSAAQRKTYEEKAYFDVELDGKSYRIHQGTHGNVRLLTPRAGRIVEAVRYCAQPDGVPAEDAMLAQKLMLETDEAAFLKVANASPLIIPAT